MTRDLLIELVYIFGFIVIIYFIILTILYTFILFFSFKYVYKYFWYDSTSNFHKIIRYDFNKLHDHGASLPGITVGISIYNKNALFLDSIYSVLRSSYKNFELIVCNDGSKDDTLEKLIDEFDLELIDFNYVEIIKTSKIKNIYKSKKYPHMFVVDKLKNAGLSDSHNMNINLSTKPYYMTLDSDSIMSKHTLSNFMATIFTGGSIVCVGGSVHIANGCIIKKGKIIESNVSKNAVESLQVNEYLRSHVFGRTGWNYLGGAIGLSGTSSIFEKKKLFEVNGFDLDTYSHDLEVVIRIQNNIAEHNEPCEIHFTPSAQVWTLVPSTLKEFIIQRNHWQRGTLKSIFRYLPNAIKLFPSKFSLRYLLFIYLEILGVYVEFISYFLVIISLLLGIISWKYTVILFLIGWFYLMILTIINNIIDGLSFDAYGKSDSLGILLLNTTLETFGFRQVYIFTNVFATFHYFINRLRGKPL